LRSLAVHRTCGQRTCQRHGASPPEIQQKLGRILEGADLPASEQAGFDMLAEAGFEQPQRFFGSLFWGAWVARRSAT